MTLPPGVRFLQENLDSDVEACSRSIKEDNPGMDDSTAIAISQDMQNRGVLEAYLEAEPSEEDAELAALAEFRNPGDIRRIENGDGVRYENVMLLAPGAWTDAGSRSTAIYSGEGIRASAENWVDPGTGDRVDEVEINFLHGPALHNATSLGDIGTIPTDSIVVDDQDRMYGDLVLHGESAASQTAIDVMDEVLEAVDDPQVQTPPVGPSVEIVDETSETDLQTGANRLTEMWFSGVGLVFGPASRPVEMEAQARGRAIAMADEHGYDHAGLVLRHGGSETVETTLTGMRHAGDMSNHARKQINRLLGEMQQILQMDGDLELVQTLIEQYRQAGEDMDAPASEFLEWMDENSDVAQADVEDAIGAFTEDVDAGLDDIAVAGLNEWVMEHMADDSDSGGDDDDDTAMSQEDLQEAVNTIGNFASELETVKDMLSDYRGDVNDQVSALEEEKEDLERRLQKLEDEPIRQAQEHRPADDFYDADEDASAQHEDVIL